MNSRHEFEMNIFMFEMCIAFIAIPFFAFGKSVPFLILSFSLSFLSCLLPFFLSFLLVYFCILSFNSFNNFWNTLGRRLCLCCRPLVFQFFPFLYPLSLSLFFYFFSFDISHKRYRFFAFSLVGVLLYATMA